jgi:hypothetical protein
MAKSTFGPGGKTGTVYDGPAPAKGGTVYGGPTPAQAGGTVYNGPAPGGASYNGPASGAATMQTVRRQSAASNVGAAKGANIFFLIAAFTAINIIATFAGVRFAIGLNTTLLNGAPLNTILVANGLAAGVFVMLGIFARSGSKAAFLIGMLLYGGDLVLLALNNPAVHIISIVIHGLFLFYLFNVFRQLPD